MTLRELSQLYWLNREITHDQKRLKELEQLAYAPRGSKLDGMPHMSGYGDALARSVADLADLREAIRQKQARCIVERRRLEAYIAGIEDSLTRDIFTYRFVDGLTWDDVAAHIGHSSEDAVKKTCYRYLRDHE